MHHMPRFPERSVAGPPGRCDVRVRLMVALAAILAVVISTRLWFGLAVLGCCLAGVAALRVPPRICLHRLAGPAALAAVICLARTFLAGRTPLATLDLGPWRLTATREGLLDGALVASRVLGSFGILTLACQGATVEELFAALRWAKVPCTWIEVALLMCRYLHLFREQAAGVIAAQKVRLGYRGWRRSFRSMGNLAGIVMVQSLDQAERTLEAMLARGYQGRLPLPSLPPLSRGQKTAALIGVSLVALAGFLAERGCP